MSDSLTKIIDWMVSTTRANGVLYQSQVVEFLINNFGDEFIKTNDNGNYAISSAVLARFRRRAKTM
jgi:hypothetical protein